MLDDTVRSFGSKTSQQSLDSHCASVNASHEAHRCIIVSCSSSCGSEAVFDYSSVSMRTYQIWNGVR